MYSILLPVYKGSHIRSGFKRVKYSGLNLCKGKSHQKFVELCTPLFLYATRIERIPILLRKNKSFRKMLIVFVTIPTFIRPRSFFSIMTFLRFLNFSHASLNVYIYIQTFIYFLVHMAIVYYVLKSFVFFTYSRSYCVFYRHVQFKLTNRCKEMYSLSIPSFPTTIHH